MTHTPGLDTKSQCVYNESKEDNPMTHYKCGKCGWSGEVNGRPRCLACYRKYISEWRNRYPDKVRNQRAQQDKRNRETRREWYNARRRRYRKPETNAMARRARIEWLLSGDVTREQLITVYENHQGNCHYCGKHVMARFTPFDPRGFDHVKSRSKGGKHTASNLVVCCRQCNALKR